MLLPVIQRMDRRVSSYRIAEGLDNKILQRAGNDAGMRNDIGAKVNALRELQSSSLHFGDCRCFARRSQSALTLSPSVASVMPSILDKACKGEL
jgi:hypothetical protein